MVRFCLDRYPVWEQQTKSIGLSPEQVQTTGGPAVR